MPQDRVLIVDCNDSFVYNIVQIISSFTDCDIVRCQDLDTDTLSDYTKIVLSPGPGHPNEHTKLHQIISRTYSTHSILGVCLGHQALALFFGASIYQMPAPRHGHQSLLDNISDNEILFAGINNLMVCRYHSWSIDKNTMPGCLHITSTDEEGNIMSFRHSQLPIFGVQFHPESYGTAEGGKIIANWLGAV